VTSTSRPFSFGSGNRFNLHYFGQDEPFLIKPIDFKLTKANGRVYNIPGDGAARQKIALENFQTLYPAAQSRATRAAGRVSPMSISL
jgi:hypothetical protein